jgi:catechol 2,3-dioxygenase-like lactoylglutathione lyase family enzyme
VRACVLLAAALALAGGSARADSAQVPPAPAARGAFIALSVADLEASIAWYRDTLGLRLSSRPVDSAAVKVAILEGEGLLVELIQHADAAAMPAPASAPGQGIFKAGFFVSDFDAALARLRATGAQIAFGPYPAKDGQRANVIVRDNSGNLLQLFGPKP